MQEGQTIGTFKTKSGQAILIRAITRDDVMALLDYINELSAEDTYLLMSGETVSHEQEKRYVDKSVDEVLSGNKVHLLAFIGERLVSVGEVRTMTELRKRALHVVEVSLSVHQKFRNNGIGTLMLEQLIRETKKMSGIKLLRLWVFGTNEAAKNLYSKFSFSLCGSIPEGIKYKDSYISHEIMYRKL